jgi:hypothetical protein
MAQSQERVLKRLGEAAASGGRGNEGRAPIWIVYPGICFTTEENHGNPQ